MVRFDMAVFEGSSGTEEGSAMAGKVDLTSI